MLFSEIIAVYFQNSWVMVFRQTNAVYSENHMKLPDTLLGKIADFS
jgi:hypothetical protein